MKNKKLTVTIGIPAYNEEANIGKLLKNILSQGAVNFSLDKIIIVSDGSTDQTIKEIKKIESNKINLLVNKLRKGLNRTQNNIIKLTNTDILVILNGDVLPEGKDFFKNLAEPFYRNSNVGIVGGRIKSVSQDSFVGKILANSADLKELIAQKINHGDNVYLCHGQARAFSKDFYKKLNWAYNCPEDSYSYFICKEKGFKFFYAKDAVVNFSMSSNIKDHLRQSKRFTDGIKELKKIFGTKKVDRAYAMPFVLSVSYLLIFTLRRPLLTIGYLFILLFIYFFVKNETIDHSKIEPSKSSKKLSI